MIELTTPLEGDIAAARRDDAVEPLQARDALDDVYPSPTQAAAASVGARLQAILADLDLTEATPVNVADAPPEPVEARAELAPPPSLPAPLPISPPVPPMADFDAGEPPIVEDTLVEPFPAASPVRSDETRLFDAADFEADGIEATPASYLPLAFMLLVGVTLLAVATFWFVAAHPRMGGVAPSVIGWGLGLAGIGLLATSIYFLLERIGGRDEG